jgi:hypothetical protein
VTDYNPAYGGKPLVPDPAASYREAVAANAANFPALQDLATKVNAFNLGQVTNQYTAGIPNYTALADQSSANIAAALAGDVPADVKAMLAQAAAERGVALGMPGIGLSNYDYLRSLGLTSLGQKQYGETALTGAVNRMPRTALFDLYPSLVPGAEQQAAKTAASIYGSAPVPAAAETNAMAAAQLGMRQGYNSGRQTPNYGGGYFPMQLTPAPAPTQGVSSGGYYAPRSGPVNPNAPSWAEASNTGGGNFSSYSTNAPMTPMEEEFYYGGNVTPSVPSLAVNAPMTPEEEEFYFGSNYDPFNYWPEGY